MNEQDKINQSQDPSQNDELKQFGTGQTGQGGQGQAGQTPQQPELSEQTDKASSAGLAQDSETATQQRTGSETGAPDTTGEATQEGFVGKQGEDSGDYLRREETADSDSDIEGSAEPSKLDGQ